MLIKKLSRLAVNVAQFAAVLAVLKNFKPLARNMVKGAGLLTLQINKGVTGAGRERRRVFCPCARFGNRAVKLMQYG